MEFRAAIRHVLLVMTVQWGEGPLKRTVLSQISEVEQQDLLSRTCKIVESL